MGQMHYGPGDAETWGACEGHPGDPRSIERVNAEVRDLFRRGPDPHTLVREAESKAEAHVQRTGNRADYYPALVGYLDTALLSVCRSYENKLRAANSRIVALELRIEELEA